MSWTLWRYTFLETWRLLLLSTAVIVAVIAFAAAVKPLADGKLTPVEALRFMLLAVPPMLAYALPFAAGFGTTLAFHRMAQDNEVIAAHASGIGHRTILAPALASGLILAATLGVLNEQTIPRFLQSMERLITQDMTQIMIRSIERGESARIGSMEIYADAVRRVPLDPGSPALDLLMLSGVAALEFDDEGHVQADATAAVAWVWILAASSLPPEHEAYSETGTALKIQLENGVGAVRGDITRIEQAELRTVPIPRAFRDNPKYLTFSELRELRRHPTRMNWIEARRYELARRLATVETRDAIARVAREDGAVRFEDPGGHSVLIRTAGLGGPDPWALAPIAETGRVEITIIRAGGGIDRYAAERARIQPEASAPVHPLAGAPSRALTFALELERVRVLGTQDGARIPRDPGAGTEIAERDFRGLTFAADPLQRLGTLPVEALLDEAHPLITGDRPNQFVRQAADELVDRIDDLRREITSKQHERWAMSLSCLVMVLTGAVTALRLRDSVSLTVYMWSFFPALATIIIINSGQTMAHRHGAIVGLPMLWSGVVGLGAYALGAYAIVRRH